LIAGCSHQQGGFCGKDAAFAAGGRPQLIHLLLLLLLLQATRLLQMAWWLTPMAWWLMRPA
jgi:hypothetical protein